MIINKASFRLSNIGKSRGFFIAFEGINGCGKSTLVKGISSIFAERQRAFLTTREPGGTPLGQEIRKLLLEWDGEKKSELTELLLFCADRAEHVNKIILPALAEGKIVFSDRYIYSTLTFQGDGRGLDLNILTSANNLATSGLLPDLVVLMDLDPQEALQRIERRNSNSTERDSFEEEELEFHTRIRNGFLRYAKESPAPFLVLDATVSKEENLATTLQVLGE